jgi:4-hydroxy-tetrahydrodipicolinate reductase
MPAPLTVGVASCAGRMGRAILAAALDNPGCRLAGASQYAGHAAVGGDAGQLAGCDPASVSVLADPAEMMRQVAVAIDFSTPDATMRHADCAAAAGIALVVGTTGLSSAEHAKVAAGAEKVPVLFAANMSTGATLLRRLTERLARTLDADWDIEVMGVQHRHKVDAPSGTALALAQAAARGRGLDENTVGATPRDGHTGPRPRGQIGVATVQGGDVTGEHTVIFAGDAERIELAHKPAGRHVYAAGAVRAALWLHGRPPGLYDMVDVLGL